MQLHNKVVIFGPLRDIDYYDVGMKDDAISDVMMNIERPRSWTELFKLLYSHDEFRQLKIEHGDGIFYLLYLKLATQLFAISKLFPYPIKF